MGCNELLELESSIVSSEVDRAGQSNGSTNGREGNMIVFLVHDSSEGLAACWSQDDRKRSLLSSPRL